MISLKDALFDKNTRTVHNPDTQNAFFENRSSLPINWQPETQGVRIFHPDTDNIEGNSLYFDISKYKEYIKNTLADTDTITNTTFLPPSKHRKILHNKGKHFAWHKHSSSGRSFNKAVPVDDDFGMMSFNVKGGDLIVGNKFRNTLHSYALPFIGAETVRELEHEYKLAQYVQNTALSLYGRPTYVPQPIKVNILEDYLDPKENIITPYRHIITMMTCLDMSCQYNIAQIDEKNEFGNYIRNEAKNTLSRLVVSENGYDDMYQILKPYREKFGEHGSYLYMIQGTNMRISDVLKQPSKKNICSIMRDHYPQAENDEQIVYTFMQRFAEAYGLIAGIGLKYKPGWLSKCFPVDTSISGVAMDIGPYSLQGKFFTPDYAKQHIMYLETCYTVYSFFCKPDMKEFMDIFDKYFYKSLCDTIIDVAEYVDPSMEENRSPFYESLKAERLPLLVENHKKSLKNHNNRTADMKYMKNYLNLIND